jgi:acyl carrier protein
MQTKILDVVKSIRPEANFDGVDDFIAEGLLDSFDIVTLVATLDKAYGVSIDGAEIVPENFKNLKAIETLLCKYGVQP